ncbi:MAG: glutamate-5-semialdehyde dehydrogenase [Candidatus Omnitrophica bacterium]|nr:glutamate-5-semialdehyde dehydrogenase [Candidatus Omnitrophota bacterium]MBU1933051.1 glutamate-5-semialdehyde dehydrogenase [Candidatus Omnitrophota bacterium]
MGLREKVVNILRDAKEASRVLAGISAKDKNRAIAAMARGLLKHSGDILLSNAKDLALARKKGLSEAMIDRLMLTETRIKEMSDGLKAVAGLKDPVGEVIKQWRRPNKLLIKKVRVPIGVIGIIYESRPNVTSDCSGLCLKSGNACVLRGGSEAVRSNLAVHRAITKDLAKYGIPASAVSMIDRVDRKAVDTLLTAPEFVDLIIPRGGEGLIRYVAKTSTVPVIKHYKGVCHLYVDKYADMKKALDIAYNAKVQRPGVCNAIETLLVHKDVARKFLPMAAVALRKAGVELRGCEKTRQILKGVKKAKEEDWYAEYLDLILAVKVVEDADEAIRFINKYGSNHSDAIVTKNKKIAGEFLERVDSSCVYHNASTRFTDGYQFGMGAEIGISTDKIHARGPMALEELCTYKYIILGSGQVRI